MVEYFGNILFLCDKNVIVKNNNIICKKTCYDKHLVAVKIYDVVGGFYNQHIGTKFYVSLKIMPKNN